MDHALERRLTIERGKRLFADGSRWRKAVDDRRMVIELRDDGTLTEWLEDDPADSWQGRWQISPIWEPSDYLVGLQILVGGYEARVRVIGPGPWRGYELPPKGLGAVPPEDRGHEFLYKGYFPDVTITSLAGRPPQQVALPPVDLA